MSKKNIVILVVIFIVVSIFGTLGFILISKNNSADQTDVQENLNDVNQSQDSDNQDAAGSDQPLSYSDESGFSFKYPNGYNVTDITPATDQTYYSKLSVGNSSQELTISVFDTKAKSASAWITSSESDYKTSKLTGSVSIGGIAASEYTDTTNGKIITLFIDQGIVYLFVSGDGAQSADLHKQVTTSFLFTTPKPAQTGSGSGSSQSSEIIEEEEVVE